MVDPVQAVAEHGWDAILSNTYVNTANSIFDCFASAGAAIRDFWSDMIAPVIDAISSVFKRISAWIDYYARLNPAAISSVTIGFVGGVVFALFFNWCCVAPTYEDVLPPSPPPEPNRHRRNNSLGINTQNLKVPSPSPIHRLPPPDSAQSEPPPMTIIITPPSPRSHSAGVRRDPTPFEESEGGEENFVEAEPLPASAPAAPVPKPSANRFDDEPDEADTNELRAITRRIVVRSPTPVHLIVGVRPASSGSVIARDEDDLDLTGIGSDMPHAGRASQLGLVSGGAVQPSASALVGASSAATASSGSVAVISGERANLAGGAAAHVSALVGVMPAAPLRGPQHQPTASALTFGTSGVSVSSSVVVAATGGGTNSSLGGATPSTSAVLALPPLPPRPAQPSVPPLPPAPARSQRPMSTRIAAFVRPIDAASRPGDDRRLLTGAAQANRHIGLGRFAIARRRDEQQS